MKTINIAIDGPAGAGKSTVAKMVAKKLGFIYVDTGAMYRAMAVHMLDKNVDLNNHEKISEEANNAFVTIKYIDGAQRVFLNQVDVTNRLRTEETGNAASVTSAIPNVRKVLESLQKDLAASENVVMDGRDIGTTILPKADLKIFLTASSEERAKRRVLELQAKNEPADFEKIKKDIEDRDYRDSHREISPLKQADDAILIDSSNMTIDEVVASIISRCNFESWSS